MGHAAMSLPPERAAEGSWRMSVKATTATAIDIKVIARYLII
jgi:hypothetical protein